MHRDTNGSARNDQKTGHQALDALRQKVGRSGARTNFASRTALSVPQNGLSESDLKLLQLGGDSGRLTGLTTGKVQYTFLGDETGLALIELEEGNRQESRS